MKHNIEKPTAPKSDDYLEPDNWKQTLRKTAYLTVWSPFVLAGMILLFSIPALLIGLILYVVTGGRARMW